MRLEKHYDIRTDEIVILDIDRREVVRRYRSFDLAEEWTARELRRLQYLREPECLEDSRLWC